MHPRYGNFQETEKKNGTETLWEKKKGNHSRGYYLLFAESSSSTPEISAGSGLPE